MSDFIPGDVVICGTGQSGTLIDLGKDDVSVLLRNGDIWIGHPGMVRKPQDQADLDAAPLDIDKYKNKG